MSMTPYASRNYRDGLSVYTYVRSSPIRSRDPNGLRCCMSNNHLQFTPPRPRGNESFPKPALWQCDPHNYHYDPNDVNGPHSEGAHGGWQSEAVFIQECRAHCARIWDGFPCEEGNADCRRWKNRLQDSCERGCQIYWDNPPPPGHDSQSPCDHLREKKPFADCKLQHINGNWVIEPDWPMSLSDHDQPGEPMLLTRQCDDFIVTCKVY